MSQPNALEQLMLELINEERAAIGLQPLRFNGDLNEASEDHSDWMLDQDIFSHTGQGGSSAGDRIQEAGYELEGNWTWGENIAWQSERGAPGLEDDVRNLHETLMNSPGHRANILNANYEEIGIGIERGDFQNYDSVMVTQNFGTTDATPAPPAPPAPPSPAPTPPVVVNPLEPTAPTPPVVVDQPVAPTPPVVVDQPSPPDGPPPWNPLAPQGPNATPFFADFFVDVFDFSPSQPFNLADLLDNLLDFTPFSPVQPPQPDSTPTTPDEVTLDLFGLNGVTFTTGLYDGFDVGA